MIPFNLIHQVKPLLSFRAREIQLAKALKNNVKKSLSLMNILRLILNLGKDEFVLQVKENNHVWWQLAQDQYWSFHVLETLFTCPFLSKKVFGERGKCVGECCLWKFIKSKSTLSLQSVVLILLVHEKSV
jgi:hypothetical protein